MYLIIVNDLFEETIEFNDETRVVEEKITGILAGGFPEFIGTNEKRILLTKEIIMASQIVIRAESTKGQRIWIKMTDLPTRVKNALTKQGHDFLDQVAMIRPSDVLKIRGIGQDSIDDIERVLEEHDLKWGGVYE